MSTRSSTRIIRRKLRELQATQDPHRIARMQLHLLLSLAWMEVNDSAQDLTLDHSTDTLAGFYAASLADVADAFPALDLLLQDRSRADVAREWATAQNAFWGRH